MTISLYFHIQKMIFIDNSKCAILSFAQALAGFLAQEYSEVSNKFSLKITSCRFVPKRY